MNAVVTAHPTIRHSVLLRFGAGWVRDGGICCDRMTCRVLLDSCRSVDTLAGVEGEPCTDGIAIVRTD
ncbi:MAG: hypothetical protein CMJ47_04580 [Planctomyces sp.]|nr:hypothetical protein [Planctomyces sp.]